ncbi:hypothetical protein CANARDRAFT_22782 [[Candida] arabinofermentans NRRL YB-2248]|uniref:Mediator of RNA polymerase II transcription subunit 20 n=1 Tax=[Candida] arabinofermentans NRRL YB-2248 TaxID=983967 RepID=A0A1E4T2T2_9ASCO|nr:hypothetical protein CANARDRAFT_22782 [[Candida] arabinofermentans NRRL YB-2248]
MVTAVLFVQNATPATITTFHDLISNELPHSLGPWNFELKIFLNNKFSKPNDIEPSQVPNKYLYTLQLSYLNNKSISIINNTKSIVTTIPNTQPVMNQNDENYNLIDDEEEDDDDIEDNFENRVSDRDAKQRKKLLEHIEKGCCNNLNMNTSENLDFLLLTKLTSLWSMKQTIKGEGGYGYMLNLNVPDNGADGENTTTTTTATTTTTSSFERFKLRTSNCFLHGTFKGFLIEIEHLDGNETKSDEKLSEIESKNQLITRFTNSISKIKNMIELYKFPEGNLCFNVLSDSKLDYMSDLCQQYCDALQF